MDPVSYQVYNKGIDMILYDEIHLYSGIHGAYVSGLNARMQNAFPKKPVFVGISATIAKPDKYCKKLFAIKSNAQVINDTDDFLVRNTIEHLNSVFYA